MDRFLALSCKRLTAPITPLHKETFLFYTQTLATVDEAFLFVAEGEEADSPVVLASATISTRLTVTPYRCTCVPPTTIQQTYSDFQCLSYSDIK